MQVNDLVFKELIKRGYSLEGNTRVWNISESKLLYITPEQAKTYLDMTKSVEYQKSVVDKEVGIINENMKEIEKAVGTKPFNLIDLGCGDGKKAVIFLEHFKKNKIRYCAVDISDFMVKKAFERLDEMNLNEMVEFQWNISDFDNIENISGLLRSGVYKNHVILLLGNTVGNFEFNELLYGVRSAMKAGDLLIIGNGLDNKDVDKIIKTYSNEPSFNFFFGLVSQLGLKKEDLDYSVRFRNSRMESYFTLKKDIKISFLDKTIYFTKGDQIITGISYKYRKDEFSSFIRLYFHDVKIFTSDDNSYAVALCKK
ncbi:MAG: L-histidine N(alpha)-methyltransferase [Nanoarchaeota archaeon]